VISYTGEGLLNAYQHGRRVSLESHALGIASIEQPTGSEFINRHPGTLAAGNLLGRQKMRALIAALVGSIAVTA
jgi:hypothetical protein